MLVVGLTGGVATGKSTVGQLLRGWGVPVIDADQVAREVVEPGTPALAALVAAFGAGVLGPSGALDRASMRARITRDPAARATLESITHPAIRAAVAQRLAALAARGEPVAVVEAALLVETGGYRAYPVLVVVSCSPETQLRRLVTRDHQSPDDARALIAAQLPLADKEAVATHVLRNDGDLAALEARTRELWQTIAPPAGPGPG